MHALAGASDHVFWTCVALAAIFALGAFFSAFWLLGRARLIEDTPVSRLRSAAQGYVEVEGRARMMAGPEISSPMSHTRCVWWRYEIHEWRSDGAGRFEWALVESDASDDLFLIADETGECIVDPQGAHVEPSVSRTWRGGTPRPIEFPRRSPWLDFGRYRYQERYIAFDVRVFATGWFRSQSSVAEFDESNDVRDLLAEWKRDQAGLLRRFDTNHDGQIDLQEWEAVRRAALEQVRAQQVERATDPNLNVLSAPPTRQPFLIAAAPRDAVARRMKSVAAGCLAVSTLGCGLAIRLLHLRGVI